MFLLISEPRQLAIAHWARRLLTDASTRVDPLQQEQRNRGSPLSNRCLAPTIDPPPVRLDSGELHGLIADDVTTYS
jgi:hypothetical protein